MQLFNADAYLQKNIHIFGSAHVPHVRNLSVGNFNLIWGKPRIERDTSQNLSEEFSDEVVLGWYTFPCFPLPEFGVCVHNLMQKPHLPSAIIQKVALEIHVTEGGTWGTCD